MSGPIPSARPSAPCCWPWPSAPSSFFVRGYRPGGVSGAWYDLVLAFVAVWLAFWPEAGVLARSPSLANALGLVLQVGATLLGCLLGYGVARGLRRAMRETRQKDRLLRRRIGEVPSGDIRKSI